MSVPTPRDVADARIAATLGELIDAAERANRVRSWNEQHDQMIEIILDAASRGEGVMIEVSNDANYIAAIPTLALPPGIAAVYFLDGAGSGPYMRTLNLDQIGRNR